MIVTKTVFLNKIDTNNTVSSSFVCAFDVSLKIFELYEILIFKAAFYTD